MSADPSEVLKERVRTLCQYVNHVKRQYEELQEENEELKEKIRKEKEQEEEEEKKQPPTPPPSPVNSFRTRLEAL